MMKKLLLLSSALFAFSFGANSQVAKQVPNAAGSPDQLEVQAQPASKTSTAGTFTVVDQLHYYFNKFYFKTATTTMTAFPYYKDPCATATDVTHCGSRFDVPAGESVTVTGLEAWVQFHPDKVHDNIGVNMFLCNLDANGLPIIPGIDSIVKTVNAISASQPILLGGDFTHSNVATPHVMTGPFAVLFRNMSTASGDTVRLLRTNGATYTNGAANPNQRCADEEGGKPYGFVRYSSQFYPTKDFTQAPGFGIGTQYEFLVAPRVTYTMQASHKMPDHVKELTDTILGSDTMCTRTNMTFTNTSSAFWEHRMYNLNQFYRKWNLYSEFQIAPTGGFSADSCITWKFEFLDIGGANDRVFLPYVNNKMITVATGRVPDIQGDCWTTNQFRARLRKMRNFGNDTQIEHTEGFKFCTKYCVPDGVGIADINGLPDVNVYPNPAQGGRTYISGLDGKNTIQVFDVLGQLIKTETTDGSKAVVDLSAHPNGTYIMRITNTGSNNSMTVRIINQN
jgi:hypothetical protein